MKVMYKLRYEREIVNLTMKYLARRQNSKCRINSKLRNGKEVEV
jgi:hypothetical protein